MATQLLNITPIKSCLLKIVSLHQSSDESVRVNYTLSSSFNTNSSYASSKPSYCEIPTKKLLLSVKYPKILILFQTWWVKINIKRLWSILKFSKMELQSTDWKKFRIEDLPDCVLLNVFNLLSYDQVANLRPVSVRFEAIAREHLNRGFYKANLLIDQKSQEIESKMPKRQSLRHRHPLNHQSMLISSLSSSKYAVTSALRLAGYKEEQFCFFFGKIIDELLKFVGQKNFGKFVWKDFEELNDLTPMATNHL